jgi:5,10-methylenetetrahydrofolate reductase
VAFFGKLRADEFVVTGEVAPPRGAGFGKLLERAKAMAKWVDAINITDNQRAQLRMANLAVAIRFVEEGIEPILQVTCRDRNRLALQSELIAASACGIRNILALTGDPLSQGSHAKAKAVFDLNTVELVSAVHSLNRGRDLSGEEFSPPTELHVGVVVNPNPDHILPQIRWLKKKIEAGAEFIQTQAIFEPTRFIRFLDALGGSPIPILAGVLIVKEADSIARLREVLPGVEIPEEIERRLSSASDPRMEGIAIAVELATALAPYCQGIHLMSAGLERTMIEVARSLHHLRVRS